jgi:hypothetical protein
VVKEGKYEEAVRAFEGSGVKIEVKGGSRDLGAAIGSDTFKSKYLSDKVSEWARQVKNLAEVAKVQPHASHALLIHAIRHRWTFLQRCMGYVLGVFDDLEKVMREAFIPAVFGKGVVISDELREVLALPVRMGGLSYSMEGKGAAVKYSDRSRWS